jgi:F-type H+-transporting ATPase subunit b
MLIDWFTVAAQVINFLILVWLLKRFLYRPILNALDAREKRIARELADAERQQNAAEKERDTYRRKTEEFEQQRDELLREAKDEAAAERRRLLDEARKAADDLRHKQQEALRREQENLHDELARRTRREVFAIAGKTLADLAGTTLQARMSDAFVRRLRELGEEEKAELADALKSSGEPALLRSAFELPSDQRAEIQHALNETFSAEIQLRFATVPDLVGGIELSASGQKVAWSIADYLDALEESVGELLEEHAPPQAKEEKEERGKEKSETAAGSDKKSAASEEST